MLAGLLATLALVSPALAAFHVKVQGDAFDLCVDNTDGKIQAGNPLQVYVPFPPIFTDTRSWKCYSGSSNQAWDCE